MNWYHWISLISLAVCIGVLTFHLIRLVKLGRPKDYASPAGSVNAGIKYSFSGAMSPKKKESAFLHLPTYTAGLLYHAGTFLSILIFLVSFFQFDLPGWTRFLAAGILLLSGASGFGILIKRLSKSLMRKLSNVDDYLSNLLVSSFHIVSAWFILPDSGSPMVYYLLVAILLLYVPLGKLKHMIYFFAARYHLGLFYGSRGTWPPSK